MSESSGYNPQPGERYVPKAVRSGDPFLSSVEKEKSIARWKDSAFKRETTGFEDHPYFYKTARTETEDKHFDNIAERHGESFINEVIPRLIGENPDRKIKILDIGGGMALFAKQIRDTFGDKVEVFTTGLRKKPAKMERLNIGEQSKLDKNDLKWRSILELHDFPEFDLMVDTVGESMYSLFAREDATTDDVEKYFNAVAAKLMPGGHASVEFDTRENWDAGKIREIFVNLEKKHGVKIDNQFYKDMGLIKIDKPKEIEQK